MKKPYAYLGSFLVVLNDYDFSTIYADIDGPGSH